MLNQTLSSLIDALSSLLARLPPLGSAGPSISVVSVRSEHPVLIPPVLLALWCSVLTLAGRIGDGSGAEVVGGGAGAARVRCPSLLPHPFGPSCRLPLLLPPDPRPLTPRPTRTAERNSSNSSSSSSSTQQQQEQQQQHRRRRRRRSEARRRVPAGGGHSGGGGVGGGAEGRGAGASPRG
eukprot:2788580-Rhodomonas_salina.1